MSRPTSRRFLARLAARRHGRAVRHGALLLGMATLGALPASAQVFNWEGASPGTTASPRNGTWNVAGNWLQNAVPTSAADRDLRFDLTTGTTAYTATNDLPGTFTLNRLQSDVTVTTVTTPVTIAGNSTSAPTNTLEFVNNGSVSPEIQSNTTTTGTPLQLQVNVSIPTATTLNITGSSTGFIAINNNQIGSISGAGAIAVNRTAGGLSLPGANTFSGGVTLNVGRLVVGNSSVLDGGNNLVSGPVGTGTLVLNGGILRSSAANATRTLANAVTVGGNVQFGETGSNTNPLVLAGPVTLTGNRELSFLAFNGSTAVDTTLGGAIDGAFGITRLGTSRVTLSSGASTFSGGFSIGPAAGGSAGTTLLGASSAGGPGALTSGPLGTGTLTLSGTSGTVLASTDATARTIDNPVVFLGSNVNMTFGQSTGGTGALTFGGTVALGTGTRNVNVANTTTTTFAGVVSGGATLQKIGDGTLVLSGADANTFTTTATVNAGTLVLFKTAAVNAVGGNVSIGDNTGTDTVRLGASNQIPNNGNVSLNTSGTPVFDLAGFSETINQLGSSNAAASVTLGAGTLTVGGNNGSSTFAGVISGPGGSLVKAGSGTQTLSNANTYTGGTTITNTTASGTAGLLITNGSALGTGAVSIQGSTNVGTALQLAGNITVANAINLASSRTVPSATTNPGSAHIRNTADSNVLSGNITLLSTGGSGFNIESAAGLLELAGTVTNSLPMGSAGRTNTFYGAGNGLVSGVITNGTNGVNNAVVKEGAGTWTFAGANTYAGATTISAGTLQLGNGGTTGSLAPASALTNNATLTFNRSNTLTQGTDFASVIGGTGAVIQAGSGTTVLTGANTYIGATTVNAGTLQAGVGTLVSTASVTVNASGTLLLAGTGRHLGANTPVTLNGGTFNTGGVSEPGGTGTIGALTLQSSSTIDLGTGASVLNFADSSAQTWAGTLSILNWSGNLVTGNGTDQLEFGDSALVAGLTPGQLAMIQFVDPAGLPAGTYAAAFAAGDFSEVVPLTAVPEPGTVAAGLLALGALGLGQRRRVRRWLATARVVKQAA